MWSATALTSAIVKLLQRSQFGTFTLAAIDHQGIRLCLSASWIGGVVGPSHVIMSCPHAISVQSSTSYQSR